MQEDSNARWAWEPTSWPGFSPMDAMVELNQKAIGATLVFNGKVFSHIMTINGGRAAFLRMRFNEDLKLWQALASSRNPDQIFAAYSSFIRNAFEQYQEESTRVLNLAQAFYSLSMDQLGPSAEAAPDDGARRHASPVVKRERARAAEERRLDSAA